MKCGNYREQLQTAYESLDKIDLSYTLNNAIETSDDLSGIVEYIESSYIGYEPLIDALNFLTLDEWQTYLEDKYNIKFVEVTTYHLHHIPERIYKKEN